MTAIPRYAMRFPSLPHDLFWYQELYFIEVRHPKLRIEECQLVDCTLGQQFGAEEYRVAVKHTGRERTTGMPCSPSQLEAALSPEVRKC